MSDDTSKRLSLDHMFVHASFQLLAGVVYGFGIYSLLERGYNSAEAGICLSLTNVINLCISPVVSNYLDNSKKHSIFESTILFSAVVLLLFVINYFLSTRSLFLSILFVACNGIYSSMEPQVNAYSSTFKSNGINIEFSGARALGSLSYALVCAVFGVLSVKYTYRSVLLGGIFFSALFLLSTIKIRKNYYEVRPGQEVIEDYKGISFKEFVINNKLFMVLCLFLAGLFVGYTSIDNFMILIAENVGGSSDDMGGILAFKAVLEALAIFAFPFLLKRFRLKSLLLFSSLGFVLKALATLLATNVLALYASQIFQTISFALVFPGMVEYIQQKMDQKEAVRGNAFFALTIGVGSIISSFFCGIISYSYGTIGLLLFALFVSVVSCIGFCITLVKMFNKNEKVSV